MPFFLLAHSSGNNCTFVDLKRVSDNGQSNEFWRRRRKRELLFRMHFALLLSLCPTPCEFQAQQLLLGPFSVSCCSGCTRGGPQASVVMDSESSSPGRPARKSGEQSMRKWQEETVHTHVCSVCPNADDGDIGVVI